MDERGIPQLNVTSMGSRQPVLDEPVGGTQSIMRALSPLISDVEPQTQGQRIARRVGEEVGASAVAAPLGFAAVPE